MRDVAGRLHSKSMSDLPKRAIAYRERNRNIRAMGYPTYAHYLKSDLWYSIRDKALTLKPNCFVCGKKATQVHHGKYRKKDLEGRDFAFLFSVCSGCHHRSEFRDADHEKLSPKQAMAKMRQLRTLRNA